MTFEHFFCAKDCSRTAPLGKLSEWNSTSLIASLADTRFKLPARTLSLLIKIICASLIRLRPQYYQMDANEALMASIRRCTALFAISKQQLSFHSFIVPSRTFSSKAARLTLWKLPTRPALPAATKDYCLPPHQLPARAVRGAS